MKFQELRTRLKNKFTVRIIAGVLVITLAGSGVGAYSVMADTNKKQETVEEAESSADELSEDVEKALGSISTSDEKADKEESIYVISDATGKATKTIVVGHLTNKNKLDTIEDVTSLKDIENTKGDETFQQNGDKVTWNAGGKDIYYSGTTSEQVPVTQSVKYTLDGKEITPEELAGKSGKVTIRFDYKNNTSYTETVNGKDYTVNVPFIAVTALALDDSFTNVEVTNGRIQEKDSSNIVLGYALPGLKDSLEVEDSKLNDAKIPEYFEITADVENFNLSTAMTFVVNATSYASADSSEVTGDFDGVISNLTDAMSQLTDGSGQLSDGAGDLSEGLETLQSSLGEFSDGMTTLKNGVNSYLSGSKKINKGLKDLKKNVPSLSKGVSSLDAGADQLDEGASSLKTGVKSYTDGVASANKGASDLATGAKSLSQGVDQLAGALAAMPDSVKAGIQAGIDQLNANPTAIALLNAAGFSSSKVTLSNLNEAATKASSGYSTMVAAAKQSFMAAGLPEDQATAEATKAVLTIINSLAQLQGALNVYTQIDAAVDASAGDVKKLSDGAKQVSKGASALSTGLGTLAEKSSDLKDGAAKLSDGANALATGTQALVDKLPALTSGIGQLTEGSNKLVANNTQLSNGVLKLYNGTGSIVDGVDKLTDGSGKLSEGASKLADGIVEFNEKGIEKLVNSYDGDLKPFADRLQAIINAGSDYQSFTGLADNQKGTVKFIYKLSFETSKDEN